jgi:hypothetical protein
MVDTDQRRKEVNETLTPIHLLTYCVGSETCVMKLYAFILLSAVFHKSVHFL